MGAYQCLTNDGHVLVRGSMFYHFCLCGWVVANFHARHFCMRQRWFFDFRWSHLSDGKRWCHISLSNNNAVLCPIIYAACAGYSAASTQSQEGHGVMWRGCKVAGGQCNYWFPACLELILLWLYQLQRTCPQFHEAQVILLARALEVFCRELAHLSQLSDYACV